MDLKTPTTTESKAPREPDSPVKLYARAIASESRRFYHGLTRENITSFLKTMAWAAPLTVLIWVYAECEQQVTDANQPISIEVKSRDPNKIVTLDRGVRSIICDLSGPRSNLDRFKETLSTAAPITIELDTRQMTDRDEFIPTLDNLRENPRFKDYGVTIEKCDPASLPVYIDTLEKRTVPVKAPPNVPGLKSVSFDPPTIIVEGPSRYLKGFTEVTAEISALPSLGTPGVHPPENVSLQSDPSGALTYEPAQVKATLTVAQTDVHGSINFPIWLEVLPSLTKNYDISPGSLFTPKVDVVGPQDQITRLEQGEVSPIPLALLQIDESNVRSTSPIPLKIEGLPPGVHLAGPPPEVTFSATARQ